MMINFYKWCADTPENCPKSVEDIVGKTLKTVEVKRGSDDDEIVMVFEDNTACKFYHEQDCCETVVIEDVNGDWDDLVGTPLLVAEERSGDAGNKDGWEESYTWTFYTFRSIKGSVDVRWYGCSNGYYSESVDFSGGLVL